MSTLKKDHVAGAGGGAVAGGAIGAAVGGVIAGPPGLALGAAAGTAIGAVMGHKASEASDGSGNLGHYEQIYQTMPYYVSDMKWSDYEPAYRYGLRTHAEHPSSAFAHAEADLEAGWQAAKGGSRLLWSEARAAVEHAWTELTETRTNRADNATD